MGSRPGPISCLPVTSTAYSSTAPGKQPSEVLADELSLTVFLLVFPTPPSLSSLVWKILPQSFFSVSPWTPKSLTRILLISSVAA